MKPFTVIGDVHANMAAYRTILAALPPREQTIQLGDFGYNFTAVPPKFPKRHKFIRGNHDDPAKCRKHGNYLGEFGYIPSKKLFYIGGAWSIDRAYRTSGISWWEEEEMSMAQLQAAIDLYAEKKPQIVLSHECPSSATKILLMDLLGEYFYEKGKCADSRTAQALQQMLEIHQPKRWYFGHYHLAKEFQIGKTTFRCCAINEAVQVNGERKP